MRNARERIRGWIPRWIKHDERLRRWLLPEEVVLGLDAIQEDDRVPRVMFDVGAHVGSTCVPFLRKGWEVFAFEPDAANRARLESQVVSRYPNRITVEPVAVSDESADAVPFFASPVSTGISGLHSFHESHRQTTEVETITIDDYCRAHDIDDIGFLKVDVEGFDLDVLRGVPWDRIAPSVVVCEFDDHKTRPRGYDFHDMCGFLGDRGYTVLVSEWYPSIGNYGLPHRWRALSTYPCALADPLDCGNLIAFRSAAHAQKATRIASKYAPLWRAATLIRHQTRV